MDFKLLQEWALNNPCARADQDLDERWFRTDHRRNVRVCLSVNR